MSSDYSEAQILAQIRDLCASPGYIHALAHICFRDQFLKVAGRMEASTLYPQYKPEVLLRTEISVLLGSMIKSAIDLAVPEKSLLAHYIKESDRLLADLHNTMLPNLSGFGADRLSPQGFEKLLTSGQSLKEAIFYHGESAFPFQYFAFAESRYKNDDLWLRAKMGFRIADAVNVFKAIEQVSLVKVNLAHMLQHNKHPQVSRLDTLSFDINEIIEMSGLERTIIESVLDSLAVGEAERNLQFLEIGDFNVCNARPILHLGNDQYVSFLRYLLAESLYESPFFWLFADKTYRETAARNRGQFCEQFVLDRLRIAFPESAINVNVELVPKRSNIGGEIDILLSFGGRAVIFQAKSKKLTLASRKGSDRQIKSDFQSAIQDAYDQGLECARMLLDPTVDIRNRAGTTVSVPRQYSKVYIVPILSENYPALSHQVRHFLKYETDRILAPPLVMDLFYFDVLTEFLNKPLYFFAYLDRRIEFYDRFISNQELTILSHFLKRNLHLDSNTSMMLLADDIASDLDAAMIVRREGWPGTDTPEGILTKNHDTEIGRIIQQLLEVDDEKKLDIGSFLLSLSEDAVVRASGQLQTLRNRTILDGQTHDLSIEFKEISTGLTFHYTVKPIEEAIIDLARYCERRKYKQRANRWFGICLAPEPFFIRWIVELTGLWALNYQLDVETANMASSNRDVSFGVPKSEKVGRNERCPCGSGKKFKYCCGA